LFFSIALCQKQSITTQKEVETTTTTTLPRQVWGEKDFRRGLVEFLGALKHHYKRICPSDVSPHITLSAFFSAVCGRIDLKFGKSVLSVPSLLFSQLLL
jgi:hypothetical protein